MSVAKPPKERVDSVTDRVASTAGIYGGPTLAKDTEKLIRQLSLISYLMAERRPVTATEIRRDVEGYSDMTEDAFARRFYADRSELDGLGIRLTVDRPVDGLSEQENYSLAPESFFLPDIAFTDDFPSEPLVVPFDRRLLSQAVTNIVKNATEAVAAVPEAERGPGAIHVSVREEGADIIAIEVTDNGKGFPVENRQRLLEPYMTTRDGGTGLGLAIVSKILEDHGGGIELLDNPAGRGGRVRMWISRTNEAATVADAAPKLHRTGS